MKPFSPVRNCSRAFYDFKTLLWPSQQGRVVTGQKTNDKRQMTKEKIKNKKNLWVWEKDPSIALRSTQDDRNSGALHSE